VTVNALGQGLDKEAWIRAYGIGSRGIGGGNVQWPSLKEERLGAQLDLFRLFAQGKWDAFQFVVNFLNTGKTNLNDMVQDVVHQIFNPMTRDLRRYIIQNWDAPKAIAPASDRVVQFDHNSAVYKDAIASLNRVRDAVAESNEYSDLEDKAQRLYELDASNTLLKAGRARVEVLQALTMKCLRYLADKFVEGIVSVVIGTAIIALVTLMGLQLPH